MSNPSTSSTGTGTALGRGGGAGEPAVQPPRLHVECTMRGGVRQVQYAPVRPQGRWAKGIPRREKKVPATNAIQCACVGACCGVVWWM
jgi:hypothetical protein